MTDFCNHYPPGGMCHGLCQKGVVFSTVKVNQEGKPTTFPCFDVSAQSACALAEYQTPEQVAEEDARVVEFINKLKAFMARETDVCLFCGKQVTSLQQVGRCIYGSCGCRMWQGKVPETWKKVKP
jgi:hypothetical protein